ncbi:conserved hypothetical protein [Leishmania infantum JPCM5]|uniref:VHS_domain_containing_protein_-_putative n=3 Tax=Leishmania donovani species complex TaxID=38574 RepID=A0A6L0XV18_LEIIN|nr:conserved hypothetical protein [Leishmania infantum JPCM5]AYU83893.1 VHS domain containing protein, putative [Leishmania donovani]CAC9552329.1 VHS_domain_containing_protein_-_putative [Leishmania infantum]CAM73020.1 conserved hypothetical protein [Leishmania infantum JPCM5]SUZ46917.1 VHS_domain_containing_protein_-_putative [Leishmania infantum]|eukprot:XP_001469905.1 conserved hypothetical protein [Leishmania infantum JPCM5]
MVQLSLIEEIKDKALRLMPNPYADIVEECTAPQLLIPTYEHVKFLCETVNKKPESTVDVVRAIRRRIADSHVAVKHLTIQLLESMIKSCSTWFHIEVATQKGLLRDLVAVACVQPTTGRAMQAKESALLLTLNLSIWFRGHPAEECYILTTLADDVRNQMGPNCFEGLEPERNARMKVEVHAPNRNRRQPGQRSDAGHDYQGERSHGHHRDKRSVVDAIAINLPTSERVSAMLEMCMTFSDYVNNTETNPNVCLRDDEVVQSYLSQLREDHIYVTILLSSNLQLDRDLLRTVSDSQSAVLAKVEKSMARPRADATPEGSSALPPALQQTLMRSAVDTEQNSSGVSAFQETGMQQRPPPPRAEVPSGSVGMAGTSPAPVSTPPLAAAPVAEDLFGNGQSAPQATPSMPKLPVPSMEEPGSPPARSPPAASPEETADAVEPAVGDFATTAPTSSNAAAPSLMRAEAGDAAGAEEVPAPLQHAVSQSTSAAEAAAAPAPPTADLSKDADDFDAFLEGHGVS